MKKTKLLLFFFIILPVIFIQKNNVYGQIPSSPRSREVTRRIKPKLQKELAKDSLNFGPVFIRIFKESSELELWVKKDSKYDLFKTYKICYFSGEPGPKLRRGDNQSPEGFYYVKPNQLNPYSTFHLSFNIGYPNSYDRSHRRTGGSIMIHGNCVSIGCYAMTDSSIEEIYTLADAAFRSGQRFFRVHIFPFRMTEEKMEENSDARWINFWRNLKQGYDYFENHKLPPNVLVRDRKYVFQNNDE